jgi:hypothetical protein
LLWINVGEPWIALPRIELPLGHVPRTRINNPPKPPS